MLLGILILENDFVGFLHCESGLTGLDLSKLVLAAFENFGFTFKESGAHFIVCVPIRDWLEKMQVT